jgi:hypothetical protein
VTSGALLALFCACVPLLVFAGCGEDELETFRKEQLAPLEQRIDRARAEISARLREVRPGLKGDAEALRRDIKQLLKEAQAAAKLEAPEAAAKAKRAYARAASGLVRELRSFADVLERGTAAQLERAAERTRDALGALQSARIALDQAVGQ